jgi:ABC-2 type transport system permease protein
MTTPVQTFAPGPTYGASGLFQRLRWRLLRNTLRVLFRQALTRIITIALCSLFVWGAVFAIAYLGFRELKVRWHVPLDLEIIGSTFDLMFMVLSILLIFSTGIILYSSLFSSAETGFLLGGPVAEDKVFAYKFQGAVGFSSWAFIMLGSPILIAYGLVGPSSGAAGSPWYFYAVLPLFFVGFVLLPGSMGALACMLLVNLIPRHRKQVALGVLLAAAGLVSWWAYRQFVLPTRSLFGTPEWLNQVFGAVVLVRAPLVPSHWIAQGLKAAALGDLHASAYYLALIWSNGLALYVVSAWVAGRLYRRGYNRLVTGGTLRRRYGGAWLDACLSRLLFFLDPQTRLLIIKDFRTFRRDSAQWAQILLFVALAVLYFINVRRFYQADIGRSYQNGISLLNLVATSFLMCAYTGRFIYPLLSLEGRKFWILGLLPLERDRLLWGKFAFSATGCLLIADVLVLFSDLMMELTWPMIAMHVLTIAVLGLGFSGLSVGLGACMPNFRETDPSKIAVGFGGTLNLVTGLLLLALVIGLIAVPWHLVIAARGAPELDLLGTDWWLLATAALGVGVGLAAVALPLRAGARALRGMEF